MKLSKMMFILASICMLIGFGLSNYIVNAADPMDALNNVDVSNAVVTTVDPNAMQKPTVTNPPAQTSTSETNVSDNLTAKEIKNKNAVSAGVRFMDTIMFVSGMLCCLIPIFLLGFWGMACVNPVVFDPLFNLVTFKKLHYTDVTGKQIIIRSLPIIVFGIILNGGGFKVILGRIWFWVGEYIYK